MAFEGLSPGLSELIQARRAVHESRAREEHRLFQQQLNAAFE